jgi:hypothetical protein
MNAVSAVAWSISTTAPGREEEAKLPADHHPAFEELFLLAVEK